MAISLDLRVPLVLGAHLEPSDGDILLTEDASSGSTSAGFTLADAHPASCPCCTARNPAGRALATLLQDRARGRVPFFTRVVVVTQSQAGRAAVLDALSTDPVASACFRLAV